MWSQTVRQCWYTDTIWWVNINVLPVALLSDITEQSDSSDKPNKIQIRFHWSAQQTTQDTDFMVYFLGQLSSAPIDQTSSAHPTSDGKYALSALRLTRPALHSSTIAGNYALSAPVKILQCKYERGNVLLKVSKCFTQLHAQESRQPRMDTIWKDVHCERWRDTTHSALYNQSAVTDWGSYWQILVIVESRMQLGAIQEFSPQS